jgi:ribosomal protein S18 acetylase RimI-like enzyme
MLKWKLTLMQTTEKSNVSIGRLSWKQAPLFLKLKRQLEQETDKLVVGKGERKETIFHIWIRMLAHRGRAHIYIAKIDNQPVGYISVILPRFKKFRGNVYIPTMLVKTECRGRGVGTSLLQEVEKMAKEKNKRRLELEVFASNANAIHLYEKLGFIREGCRQKAVELPHGFDDVLFMTKFLD